MMNKNITETTILNGVGFTVKIYFDGYNFKSIYKVQNNYTKTIK